MKIRPAQPHDKDAIWEILEPIVRAGETYALPRHWSREECIGYWFAPGNAVFVAEQDRIDGVYYLRANQMGGGAHVANCGYAVRQTVTGVGGRMCEHSLDAARARGFLAMQFNFVIAANERAVTLWKRYGFRTLATLPDAYRRPSGEFVDALVMHRLL